MERLAYKLAHLDNELVDLGQEEVHGLRQRFPLLRFLVLKVLGQLIQAQQGSQPSCTEFTLYFSRY